MFLRFLPYRPRSVRSCCSRAIYFGFRAVFLSAVVLASYVSLSIAHNDVSLSEPAIPEENERQVLEELTHTLLSSLSRGNPSSRMVHGGVRAQVAKDSVSVAAARQQLLSSLIEKHPEEVLRIAIPSSLRQSLPAEVQPYVEKEVNLEGNLTILCEEGKEESCLRYSLEIDDEEFSLHFATQPPESFQAGAYVHVRGVQVGKAVALASNETALMSLAASLPNTLGEQRVLVTLVNFQDKPTDRPYTANHIRGVVFNETDAFFRENSKGQTWLTGEVYGWFTIPLNSTSCNTSQIASLALTAAANAGADLSAYHRYVYVFPRNTCTWPGLSSVGGNPSQAWINSSDPPAKLFAHELGHGLGLYHSHGLDCRPSVIGTGCSTIEYGDALDTMGTASGHFNVFQKERLGWLPGSIATVSEDDTYILDPHEIATGARPQALKISKDSTGQNWYYVEYRQPIGFDSFLSGALFSNVRSGVVVHTGSPANGNSSYILDMTPDTSSWFDPALGAGQSFTDPNTGLTIAPLWTNGSGAAVHISSSPSPETCSQANPTLKISPSASQWVRAGTTVNYTVTVTNHDQANCPAAKFDLQAATPGNWTAVYASPSLTISPGNSASATLRVTSSVSASDGFYTVTAKALRTVDPIAEKQISATYVIASGLNVSVSASQGTYAPRALVSLVAGVSFAGSDVNGAAVTFTITKPNGKILKKTMRTRVGKPTQFKFRLQKKDPLGVYQVKANARLKDVSPGEASTSFTVK